MGNSKIEYRKVTPEEKLHIARLQSFVFSFKLDEKDIREKIEKGEYKSDNTYGAVTSDGRVIAGMEVIPYTMWFDGHKVPMYGIGGVASMPESRRQGNIREILVKAFEDIHEKGAVFSHLYPFSYDYYRKFGYEACGGAKKYTIPTAPARKLPNNGTAHEFFKGDDVRGDLVKVYEIYASRHNVMLSRTEERWDEILDIPMFGADRLYYWRDAESNVKSWVKFVKNGDKMQMNDMAWIDHESMLGIFQFMGMFDGAVENLSLVSSPEFIPDIYWNNLYDITIENHWIGMNRVVNAARALELMKKPDGNGKFTIKVNDEFAKWNNGTYLVEYENGESSVTSTNSDPDIELSEKALVQLILGIYPIPQISHRSDVIINANLPILTSAFPKKNIHIADFF